MNHLPHRQLFESRHQSVSVLLQGWRLFAEAHGVQTGDQVSFELVSPRRLVVKLMSTEQNKMLSGIAGTSGQQEEIQESEELRPAVSSFLDTNSMACVS